MTYRRPVLRAVAAGFLVFVTWLNLTLTFVRLDDGATSGDWLWPLAFVPTLGGFYLYVSSRLVVTASDVVVSNPLRQVVIPLGDVIDVEPGSNLLLVTPYKRFYAWGVEGANAQVASGRFGSQETLKRLILGAARTAAKRDDAQRAQYRFRRPDAFFSLYVAVTVACSAALRLGLGANG